MEEKLLTANELYEFLTDGDKKEINNENLYNLEIKLKKDLDLEKQDENGNTLLHKYTLKNDPLSVELLTKTQMNLNIQNKNKETALILAIKNKFHRLSTILCQSSTFYHF